MMEQRRVASWWAQWTCVGGTHARYQPHPRAQVSSALSTRIPELWLAFALVALFGHAFEAIWRSARGTNARRL